MEDARNPMALMDAVENVVCGRGREEHKKPIYPLIQLQKMLVLFYQKGDQFNKDHK